MGKANQQLGSSNNVYGMTVGVNVTRHERLRGVIILGNMFLIVEVKNVNTHAYCMDLQIALSINEH